MNNEDLHEILRAFYLIREEEPDVNEQNVVDLVSVKLGAQVTREQISEALNHSFSLPYGIDKSLRPDE